MPGGGRVNAVPDPELRRGASPGVFKDLGEVHDLRAVLAGQSSDDVGQGRDLLLPVGGFVEGRAGRTGERKAEDEADPGVRCASILQQLVVGLLEDFRCHALGGVIDADEHAENVGFKFQRVFGPTFGEVEDGVARDAPVQEIRPLFWGAGAEIRGEQEDIAVAQRMVRVGSPAAGAVRDGVALEEDARQGRPGRRSFFGEEGGACEQQ